MYTIAGTCGTPSAAPWRCKPGSSGHSSAAPTALPPGGSRWTPTRIFTAEAASFRGPDDWATAGDTPAEIEGYYAAEPGDVILCQEDQRTTDYGTDTWSFTRLARIDDPTDLQAKLGDGSACVTFSLTQAIDLVR